MIIDDHAEQTSILESDAKSWPQRSSACGYGESTEEPPVTAWSTSKSPFAVGESSSADGESLGTAAESPAPQSADGNDSNICGSTAIHGQCRWSYPAADGGTRGNTATTTGEQIVAFNWCCIAEEFVLCFCGNDDVISMF